MKLLNKIKHSYRLLTSDLSLPDIIQGMKSDASSTYRFYSKNSNSQEQPMMKKQRFFRLLKNLFLAFIKKLTPARRIAYVIALILFFAGISHNQGESRMVLGFLLMNILLAAELADKLTAKDELDIARNIQINMMPERPPEDDRFEIAFQYDSANTVGGDFYDFLVSPNMDGFIAMVGDISGKGMEAALHMVQVHALIHSIPYPSNLQIMLANLNKQLQVLFPPKQFLTANFLKIKSTNIFEFYRAGHLPLYHCSVINGRCNPVSPSGIGLGLTGKGQLLEHLEKADIKSASGDVLCLCTDGAIETENTEGIEFGENRLINTLNGMKQKNADQILQGLINEIGKFRGHAEKKDDITLLVIKVK
ncbi:SpoIIE family protein phosphatase [bacterium]|nr:SpoIIE family protein phosphatase [bacterium]